jgi:hypothetical protein
MSDDTPRLRPADDSETQARLREVQLLINVIEPDPRWQPTFVSDRASLLDCLGNDEPDMLRRLAFYFGRPPGVDLREPVWRVVDRLKALFPDWPYDE